MRAHMDHGVTSGDVTQPQVKRDIAVPRGATRVMIFGSAIGATATVRLYCDQHVSDPHGPENEIATGDRGIALRRPPLCFEIIKQGRIKTSDLGTIAFDRPVDRLRLQPVDQRGAVSGKIGDGIAALAQSP